MPAVQGDGAGILVQGGRVMPIFDFECADCGVVKKDKLVKTGEIVRCGCGSRMVALPAAFGLLQIHHDHYWEDLPHYPKEWKQWTGVSVGA